MMDWQWHQLDHMQIICTSLQTNNHASTSPLSFYRPDALPAAHPTAWKNWRAWLCAVCKCICKRRLTIIRNQYVKLQNIITRHPRQTNNAYTIKCEVPTMGYGEPTGWHCSNCQLLVAYYGTRMCNQVIFETAV